MIDHEPLRNGEWTCRERERQKAHTEVRAGGALVDDTKNVANT